MTNSSEPGKHSVNDYRPRLGAKKVFIILGLVLACWFVGMTIVLATIELLKGAL